MVYQKCIYLSSINIGLKFDLIYTMYISVPLSDLSIWWSFDRVPPSVVHPASPSSFLIPLLLSSFLLSPPLPPSNHFCSVHVFVCTDEVLERLTLLLGECRVVVACEGPGLMQPRYWNTSFPFSCRWGWVLGWRWVVVKWGGAGHISYKHHSKSSECLLERICWCLSHVWALPAWSRLSLHTQMLLHCAETD